MSWVSCVWTSTHDQSLVFTLPSLRDDPTKGYYVGWFDLGLNNRFHGLPITSNLVLPGGAFTYEIDHTGQFVDVYCFLPLEQCEELKGLSEKTWRVTPDVQKAHMLVLHSPICQTCSGVHREATCPFLSAFRKHSTDSDPAGPHKFLKENHKPAAHVRRTDLVKLIMQRLKYKKLILVSFHS